MACDKWEEIGLLYCSGELEEQDVKQYESHLTDCLECKNEFDSYQMEQKTFFTSEILGEAPSNAVDDEIIRVCTAKKQYTSVGLFPSLVKKSFFSVSFFILGFVVVGYFAFNMEMAKQQKQKISVETTNSNSQIIAQQQEAITPSTNPASLKDSSKDSAIHYSRTRGNLNTNGVYPVDLK